MSITGIPKISIQSLLEQELTIQSIIKDITEDQKVGQPQNETGK